jgi:hypothetical protein
VKDFIGTKPFTALELWQSVKDFTRVKTFHRTGAVAKRERLYRDKTFQALELWQGVKEFIGTKSVTDCWYGIAKRLYRGQNFQSPGGVAKRERLRRG